MENSNRLRKESIINKFDTSTETANVEIITECKHANVVIGGKITISAEHAKVILSSTKITRLQDVPQGVPMTELPDAELRMLYQCRELIRKFAEDILYSPAEEGDLDVVLGAYR